MRLKKRKIGWPKWKKNGIRSIIILSSANILIRARETLDHEESMENAHLDIQSSLMPMSTTVVCSALVSSPYLSRSTRTICRSKKNPQ